MIYLLAREGSYGARGWESNPPPHRHTRLFFCLSVDGVLFICYGRRKCVAAHPKSENPLHSFCGRRAAHSHLLLTFLRPFRLIRACLSLSLCVLYVFLSPSPLPLPLRCRTTGQWFQRGMPGTGGRASAVCAGCSAACARTRSLRSEGWTAEGESAVQRLLGPSTYCWSFGLFVDRCSICR